MKAIWRGQVVAESDRTLLVNGYAYFPRESVRMEMLRPSARTACDLIWRNGVQFYDVVNAGESGKRAAWSYAAPLASMQATEHWIGFWEDVEIA